MEKITLKAARVNAGLSQEELADKLGVHRQTIANFEREPEKISIKIAVELCDILGIGINEIFFSSNLQNVDKENN